MAASSESANIKAEREIEVVLQHLEYQNTILLEMVGKLGVDLKVMKAENPG